MTRILISLLVCLCFAACIADDAPSGEVHVQVGDPLPAFSVTLSDGSAFSTTATDGTVRLIMFFDTSCPDCRATLPRVQQLYDNLRGESVSMAFISREEDDASVAAYWEQEGLTLPYMPTRRAASTACLPTLPSPASTLPTPKAPSATCTTTTPSPRSTNSPPK